MRKYAHYYALAFLVAAPVIADGAYSNWSGTSSESTTEIVEATIVPAKDLMRGSSGDSEQGLGVAAGAENGFAEPISRARERVTKKPFGIEIRPGYSPVENDRFDGIHVGVDFEVFDDEQETDVPIFAICDGPLQFKTKANGYGGVAVQACIIDGREVSVIYGHLDFTSIEPWFGQALQPGDRIGVLGQGFSEETDGVRKHLHLGIRQRVDLKAEDVDIRGYVHAPEDKALYLDVMDYLPQ